MADHTNPNGLLFLWWLDKNNPDDRKAVAAALDGWPLWACGLLGRAMTGYYAGSGDQHILKALETVYSTDPDCLRGITGNMSNLWPAFDTYTWTGNKAIAAALDAMFDKERPGLKPILNRYRTAPDLTPGTTVENQHVVEFLESTTPWAVGYLWTGDAELPSGGPWLARPARTHRHAAVRRAGRRRVVRPDRRVPRDRDLRRRGIRVEPGRAAGRERRGPHGRPARAGVFQRRAGHRVARFQNARLFPESQPVCQRLARFSSRAEGRRRLL